MFLWVASCEEYSQRTSNHSTRKGSWLLWHQSKGSDDTRTIPRPAQPCGVLRLIIRIQDDVEFPRLVFVDELDEGYGIAPRGYRTDVTLELREGIAFPVAFYDAAALCEELEAREKWGIGRFVAEPGLVVVPEITASSMKASVSELIDIGYFEHLRPVAEATDQSLAPTGNKPAS